MGRLPHHGLLELVLSHVLPPLSMALSVRKKEAKKSQKFTFPQRVGTSCGEDPRQDQMYSPVKEDLRAVSTDSDQGGEGV